jgi:predicted PurR-regulated permease PerM
MIDPAAAWAVAWRIVLLGLAVVVAVWLALAIQTILLQLLVALILATGLSPLVERLHGHGLPRGVSVLLIYVLFLVGLALLGLAVVPPVVDQAQSLITEAPQYPDRAVELLRELRGRFPFLPPLDEQLGEQIHQLGGQVGTLLAQALGVVWLVLGVFSGLVSAVLILLLTLYLVIDGPRIEAYVLSFFPPGQHARLGRVAQAIGRRMGGWLFGQVVLSVTVGALIYLGLTVLGVKGASTLAAIAAIGEVIPMVGPILAAVPAVIVALIQSPEQALATLVLYVIVQQVENNLLVPKIMQQAVELDPLAVVVAIMIGGELRGVVGALVAVPVAAALAVVLDELRDRGAVARPLAERVEAGATPAAASAAEAPQPAEREQPGGQRRPVADRLVAPQRQQRGRRRGGDRRAD